MDRRIYSILIGWFFAIDLFAYPTPVDFSGDLLRWDKSDLGEDITYRLDMVSENTPIYLAALVDEATLIWSNVEGSSLRIRIANPDETEDILVTINSTIEGSQYSAGFSIFDEVSKDGKPVHCRIDILDDLGYDGFSKTILHEMGHCVGLGHSMVPESIMSYDLDKSSYELDLDDKAAIIRLYPEDGGQPRLPPGCSIGTSASTSGFSPFVLLLPVLLNLRRRKRATRLDRP